MSPKTVALLCTLLPALLVSACGEGARRPRATPVATPRATATRSLPPAVSATPPPTATAVGLPRAGGEAVGPEEDLSGPPPTPGWTTVPVTQPVTALAQGAGGAVWVGQEAGSFRFPARAPGAPRTALDGDLAQAAVNTFFPLPGGMWVGHEEGAAFLERESGEWHHLRPGVAPSAGLYRGDVQTMTADGDGRLWFGTAGGVTVWDGNRFFYDDFLTVEERFAGQRPHFVYALLFDGAELWAGTRRGLFSYDAEYRLTRYDARDLQAGSGAGEADPAVRALALDDGGRLLLAVKRRLLRLEADGSFSTLFVAPENVHTITVSGGDVWLGLADDGLLRGRAGQWAEVAGPDGAPLAGRHVLVDDAGARWFAARDSARLWRYVP